jgi:isopentenyl phosphate kinase
MSAVAPMISSDNCRSLAFIAAVLISPARFRLERIIFCRDDYLVISASLPTISAAALAHFARRACRGSATDIASSIARKLAGVADFSRYGRSFWLMGLQDRPAELDFGE